MINVYWCPQTRSMRTLWLLEELGEPYERTLINLRDPATRNNEGFQAASPMGKVPALSDGEVHLAESAALALYLADRYPEADLAPALESPLRGLYLYWSLYTPAVIEPAMMERFNQWEVNPTSSGWGNFDLMIKTLEAHLTGNQWAIGDQFTAADTLLGSSAHFMKMFGILPESPAIEAYLERCQQRPAHERALAIEAEGVEQLQQ